MTSSLNSQTYLQKKKNSLALEKNIYVQINCQLAEESIWCSKLLSIAEVLLVKLLSSREIKFQSYYHV